VPTAVSPNLEYGAVRRFSPNRPRRAWLAKHLPSLTVAFLSLVGTAVPCGSPVLVIARGLTPQGKTADGAVLQVTASQHTPPAQANSPETTRPDTSVRRWLRPWNR
jgi:hypothetical protein